MPSKPDYGVDAPNVIRNLFAFGILGLVLFPFFHFLRVGPVIFDFKSTFLITGISCLAGGLLMLGYAKVGKFGHRDRIVAQIAWTGNEHVLDVGTGLGLLLIGAAKHLTTGKATGIDIWNSSDLTNNTLQGIFTNATIEGVRDRIDVLNEDARAMSFAPDTFDVVLSNVCLHNISEADGRRKACAEIARVLKPGGAAIISDYRNLGEYRRYFVESGLDVQRLGPFFDTFPPLGIIKCVKAGVGAADGNLLNENTRVT